MLAHRAVPSREWMKYLLPTGRLGVDVVTSLVPFALSVWLKTFPALDSPNPPLSPNVSFLVSFQNPSLWTLIWI